MSTSNFSPGGLTQPATVPQGGTGQVTLPGGAVLLGNGTSPVGNAAPAALGNVLTDQGSGSNPSFQKPVTASTVTGTLPSIYTATASWANSGLSLNLPAGTWLITGSLWIFNGAVAQGLNFRLYDATAGAVIPNSIGQFYTTSTTQLQGQYAVSCLYTVASGTATINLQAQYINNAGAQIYAGANGTSVINAVRIA